MRGARTRDRVGGFGARRGTVLEVGLDEHERRTDGVVDDLRSGRRRGHRRECVLDARLDLVGRQQVGRRDDAVEPDGEEGRGHARDEEPPPPIPRSEAVQWSARRVAHRVDAAVGLVHLVGRCWEVRHVRPFGADVNGTGDGSKGLPARRPRSSSRCKVGPRRVRGWCATVCGGVRRGAARCAGHPQSPGDCIEQASGRYRRCWAHICPASRRSPPECDVWGPQVPKLAPFRSRMSPDLKRSGPVESSGDYRQARIGPAGR